jgi:hypothetical protein
MSQKAEIGPERTSAAQISWVVDKVESMGRCFARHIGRYGLGYGFLGGVAATILTLAAVVWYGVLAYPLPWKVTDPKSHEYNKNSFQFTDYETKKDLLTALKVLLPIGTPKMEVDALLESQGGAGKTLYDMRAAAKNGETRYVYTYKNARSFIQDRLHPNLSSINGPHAWRVAIDYDEKLTVTAIHALDPW